MPSAITQRAEYCLGRGRPGARCNGTLRAGGGYLTPGTRRSFRGITPWQTSDRSGRGLVEGNHGWKRTLHWRVHPGELREFRVCRTRVLGVGNGHGVSGQPGSGGCCRPVPATEPRVTWGSILLPRSRDPVPLHPISPIGAKNDRLVHRASQSAQGCLDNGVCQKAQEHTKGVWAKASPRP